ncbi:MAG TPA: hypothetical protein VFD92_13800 [Candidatus Binatia bacterium]|nr:hypothetical protein [Candidatus Binatia bacterium]
MQAAIRRAEHVAAAFDLGNVHVFAAILYVGRGDVDEVGRRAAAIRAVGAEHGLPMLLPSGTMLEGWVSVRRGRVPGGLKRHGPPARLHPDADARALVAEVTVESKSARGRPAWS